VSIKKQKSVLVTGCAGFIGSNVTREFTCRFPNITVVGLDDLSSGRKSLVDPEVKFIRGSVADKGLLCSIFKKYKPEYVFHFAAIPRVSFSIEFPLVTSNANIIGTVTLLEVCRDFKVKRLIFSSSSSIYGGAKKLPTKEAENPPRPISPYALQKYTAEQFCKMFSDFYDLDTVSLRYFNVYGPNQYGDSAYATVISAWLEGMYFPKRRKPFLEGDGRQSRDFCFVDDVVRANIFAMQAKKKLGGEAINIAAGSPATVLEVKKLIEKTTGRTLEVQKRPPRVGDVRHTHADLSKARKLIGFKPAVHIEEGIQKTVRWFEGRKK